MTLNDYWKELFTHMWHTHARVVFERMRPNPTYNPFMVDCPSYQIQVKRFITARLSVFVHPWEILFLSSLRCIFVIFLSAPFVASPVPVTAALRVRVEHNTKTTRKQRVRTKKKIAGMASGNNINATLLKNQNKNIYENIGSAHCSLCFVRKGGCENNHSIFFCRYSLVFFLRVNIRESHIMTIAIDWPFSVHGQHLYMPKIGWNNILEHNWPTPYTVITFASYDDWIKLASKPKYGWNCALPCIRVRCGVRCRHWFLSPVDEMFMVVG